MLSSYVSLRDRAVPGIEENETVDSVLMSLTVLNRPALSEEKGSPLVELVRLVYISELG